MITVEHLTKCYGDFLAVDDLSFEIEEGHKLRLPGAVAQKVHHHEHHSVVTACPPQAGVCASTGTTFSRSPARPSGSSATCRSSHPFI
ncbi:MAG: hypothetical protein ACLRWQ_01940 [Flavonifractor plautii]